MNRVMLDGTDAVMLSEESAVGRHPVEAVQTLVAIAREAEGALAPRAADPRPGGDGKAAAGGPADDAGRPPGAAAILTPTSAGRTPRAIARHRPAPPIVALC